MKKYVCSGFLMALLYPISWFLLQGQDWFRLLYGNEVLAAIMTANAVLSVLFALYLMRRVAASAPPIWQGPIVRFGGAEVAGLLTVVGIYVLIGLVTGELPKVSFGGIFTIQMPGFLAAFASYVIAHLLVEPVTPAPAPQGRHRRK